MPEIVYLQNRKPAVQPAVALEAMKADIKAVRDYGAAVALASHYTRVASRVDKATTVTAVVAALLSRPDASAD